MSDVARRDTLSDSLKRALVIILEDGQIIKQAGLWRGSSGRAVPLQTVLALFDRYLIKIVVESRHRRRHAAKLTDVGEYAAEQIAVELYPERHGENRSTSTKISMNASLLATEIASS